MRGFFSCIHMMHSPYCATPLPSLKCYTFREQPPVSRILSFLRMTPVCGILSQIFQTLSSCDDSWMQATLPVKRGGIGIRIAVHLASSSFLASAEGSADLVKRVLLKSLCASPVRLLETAKDKCREGHAQSPPAPPDSCITSEDLGFP